MCRRPGEVSYRVADELPWLNRQLGEKEALHDNLLNLCIFVQLYGRYVVVLQYVLGLYGMFFIRKTNLHQVAPVEIACRCNCTCWWHGTCSTSN